MRKEVVVALPRWFASREGEYVRVEVEEHKPCPWCGSPVDPTPARKGWYWRCSKCSYSHRAAAASLHVIESWVE